MKRIIVAVLISVFMAVASFANALTTDEALQVLDSASSQAALTRSDHRIVIESVQLLRSTLKDLNEKLQAKNEKEEPRRIETSPTGMPEE